MYIVKASLWLHGNFCCRPNFVFEDWDACLMKQKYVAFSMALPDFCCVYDSLFHIGLQDQCFNKKLKKVEMFAAKFTALSPSIKDWCPYRAKCLKNIF